MQVLYFDPDKERAARFLSKFKNAQHASTPREAIEKMTAAKFDIVCIYQYENCMLCEFSEAHLREDSEDVIDWIMINLPVLKQVWLHGDDFTTIGRYRNTLNACGYSAKYMPLDSMLQLNGS